jgi:ADP-ribosylglycohydrolase
MAANLGEDAGTTAAITGQLAALFTVHQTFPKTQSIGSHGESKSR